MRLYAERPSLSRYLAVAGCLALGLMAKPMLVTVPFILLLLDYWPLDRFSRSAAGACPPAASRWWLGRLPVAWRLVVEKVPLLAVAAVNCKIVLSFHLPDPLANPYDRVSLATRLSNALVSYAIYVGQSLYPVNMAPYYPLRTHVPIAWAAGAFVLLVSITAVATYCWRRRPYVPVGWLWFLGMLVPVIGLMQFGAHARADRYTYLSQIGLSIALAWSAWSVYRSRQSVDAASWRRWMLAGVSGGAVLLLAAVAWRQTSYWRNAETLWTHTIACTEQNMLAQYQLAYSYTLQDKTTEAMAHLREALAAESVDRMLIARSHGLYGDCLASQGKIDEALAQYEQAVRVFPTAPMFHDRLAIALAGRDQLDRAIAEFRETVRLAPTVWSARLNLADALLAAGDASEAAAQCREILQQEPGAIEAMAILGAALAAEGEVEEAFPHLKRALEFQPGNARAHFHLGLALYGRGQPQNAIAHLNAAIRLQPDTVSTLWPLAWILATSPDPSVRDGARAVGLAKKAIKLSSGQEARAFDALAAALAETAEFSAAVDAAERASTLALLRSDVALADAVEQRTRLYRQGLPYRQSAPPVPTGHARPEMHE